MKRVYKKDKLEEIVEKSETYEDILYNLGLPYSEKRISRLRDALREYNIDFSKFKKKNDISFKREEIINAFHKAKSCSDMLERLKIHKTNRNLTILRKKLRDLNLNYDHFFDNPKINNFDVLLKQDCESYYWVGFLMADGTFTHSTGQICLELSAKDKEHLLKIANILKVPVHYRTRKLKDKFYDMCNINCTCKIGFEKLKEKFDIKSKKSHNPPTSLNIQNNDLFVSFLIGFLDGDGSITKNSNGRGIRISMDNHISWLNVINNWSKRLYVLSEATFKSNPAKINRRGLSTLNIKNIKVFNFLISKIDELKLPVLNRKWNIMRNYLEGKNV